MTTISETAFARREIYVNEICFHSREDICLFGFLHEGGKFHETQYVIARKDLQMLLSSNKSGIEILWNIENLFLQPHQVPATLNLIDLFGITQVFEAQNIELDIPMYKNESGEWQTCETPGLLFIEKITPLPSASKTSF